MMHGRRRTDLTRRDFLNGLLLAAGGAAVTGSTPLHAFGAASRCDGPIGEDARALRGGNLPSTFEVAHWLRDARLTFSRHAVTLAPGCDTQAGPFPLRDDTGVYDLIVVGTGIAGLATAVFTLRRRRRARVLLLDANETLGGNARADTGTPLPVPASTAGSYCVAPYADFLRTFYRTIGLDWERYTVAPPFYSYYFDDRTPGVLPGRRGWNVDTYGAGLRSVPYSPEIVRQLVECKRVFTEWGDRDGAPTDPPDDSDPKYDYLSRMSLDEYLAKELHADPIVSDFYTRYTIDALAGTTAQVNAHSAIAFLGGEYNAPFAFPGGNAGVARLASDWLAQPNHRVELRQGAVVVRVDPGSVVFHKDGAFYRARTRAVVIAGGSHTARHLVDHLIDDRRRRAWREFNTVPVIVANVAVRSAAPFVDASLGYNEYWWGGKYFADFVVADWATPERSRRDRPTVLTFFGGNTAPPEELAGERFKLLDTPFGNYEASLRDDLSRVMAGTRFDFDRDVTAIFLYRWGHGMVLASPGFVFGSGRDRPSGPRHIATAPLDRIVFAGQDVAGTPSIECAIASGQRAAEEVLKYL